MSGMGHKQTSSSRTKSAISPLGAILVENSALEAVSNFLHAQHISRHRTLGCPHGARTRRAGRLNRPRLPSFGRCFPRARGRDADSSPVSGSAPPFRTLVALQYCVHVTKRCCFGAVLICPRSKLLNYHSSLGRNPTVIGKSCPSVFAAGYLGLNIENLSNLLLELERRKLIEAYSGGVRLKDIGALEKLASHTVAPLCKSK